MAYWLAAAVAAGAGAGYLGTKAAQRYLRKARDDHSKRPALWNRFYAIDWGDTATNNYGFAPADGEHPQRFQHQMYLELLNRLRSVREPQPGFRLLEVSCGRGGGLNAIRAQAPQIDFTGLDVAHSAVDFCRRTYGEVDGLKFVQGNALDLPFSDHSFDAVLNVEASNDYGDRPRFFREVARVLKDDGIFLYTDTVRSAGLEPLQEDLRAAGFDFEFDDITANVVEACRLDSPRRREVIARHAPLPIRLLFGKQLAKYAAIEGSGKFRAFAEGRRRYVMTAARKA